MLITVSDFSLESLSRIVGPVLSLRWGDVGQVGPHSSQDTPVAISQRTWIKGEIRNDDRFL